MTAISGSRIRDGLDPQQLEAVLAPRGPVCVLAGAGTGKTRTITRRIAALVESGQVNPGQVLAVTFTSRAAAEMRERLAALGVAGPGSQISALTFHAAALRQLRYFWPQVYGSARWQLMDTKFPMVRRAAREAGLDTADRELVRDLAAEIEWAKSSLIDPSAYVERTRDGTRDLPLRAEMIAEVFRAYEQGKTDPAGDFLLDFEDLIGFTTLALDSDPAIAEEFRTRYRSFVVDEYQDVTPLQQGLLQAWLGGRDDLTVVGDANQTIYSFTAATPDYLLDFTRVYPEATLVRLERDYRSTPQVVALANAVIGKAVGRVAGTRLELIGMRPDGPEPVFAPYPDENSEVVGVVAEIKRLLRAGVAPGEIAVLYRINAASEAYEEALSAAGIDYRVRGDRGFFERPQVAAALRRLTALADGPPPEMSAAAAVRKALTPLGYAQTEPPGAQAKVNWQQMTRLVELADELLAARPAAGFAELVAALTARARTEGESDGGITLASFHAAKGLEWDAVLLTGLHEGSVPLGRASGTPAELEEERRLLYVGITRARVHLHLSWSAARSEGRPATRRRSRFLDGLAPAETAGGAPVPPPTGPDRAVHAALQEWRADYAAAHNIAEPNVCSGNALKQLARALPATREELARISGMNAERIEMLGEQILAVIAENRETAGQK
ncbi:ATP-dependent DNA helicase UvrD2 [Gordonia hirsuta DSM 44140 = NBRC 16056]|uniref:DNA 3'-5' helicase n=1 Tax=Gordonia hirsuta DSM 44140 = NBRC 16056 TaxID=1121927 RepID=L7L602_9ACTN|nr:ATP-dependent DNA helicase UvrD2 [Gordonia hirsuta]GAC56374.1 ATP-dependent DNA helicase UvrD2 [Gordonia hirsuta DSM 44140 = NBRC 16056]